MVKLVQLEADVGVDAVAVEATAGAKMTNDECSALKMTQSRQYE